MLAYSLDLEFGISFYQYHFFLGLTETNDGGNLSIQQTERDSVTIFKELIMGRSYERVNLIEANSCSIIDITSTYSDWASLQIDTILDQNSPVHSQLMHDKFNPLMIRNYLGIEPLIYKCFDNKLEIKNSFTKKEGELLVLF